VTIKAKVEKLIKVGFIYPVQLMEWLWNHVLVNKNQGMIHICMEFCDMNKYFSKDNFPTPFIDHIVDECAGFEVFFFMDGFPSTIKFRSILRINIKWILFVLGVQSCIQKCLLSLRMMEPLFSEPCCFLSTTSNT
jgi:hypothetical protein